MRTNLPEPDEIEVSIFGPGFGESVVVHLGLREWLIVDSCLEQSSSSAAPLKYLQRIGVDPATDVRCIIATHWHKDHIQGLAEIVRECPKAKFVCSQALFGREFIALTELWKRQGQSASPLREFSEIHLELSRSGRLNKNADGDIGVRYASANRRIWKRGVSTIEPKDSGVDVWSLSPSDAAIMKSYDSIEALFPSGPHLVQPISSKPNQHAVALWVRVGKLCCLLGADLEERNNPLGGWRLIVESKERPNGMATLFKVPHHGSLTGEYAPVWKKMLGEHPLALLTPFHSGRTRLPTSDDVVRIHGKTPNCFITATLKEGSSRSRTGTVNRTIRETVNSIRRVNDRFGHIRVRKKINDSNGQDWRTELFGSACSLEALL